MILRLKNADFSSDYVEKIAMPKELDPFTLAAITASGNQTMSDAQKLALDDFFEVLGTFENNGVWAKLDKVYLPMICGTLSTACVNYKDLDNSGTAPVPDSSWLEIRNNGLGMKAGATKGTTLVLDSSYIWDWSDKSVFILNAETIDASTHKKCSITAWNGQSASSLIRWEKLDVLYSSSSPSVPCLLDAIQTNTSFLTASSGYDRFCTESTQKLRGCSCNGTNYITATGSSVDEYPLTETIVTDSNPQSLMFAGGLNGGISANDAAVGIIITGGYLNETEVTLLTEAANTLWSEFTK